MPAHKRRVPRLFIERDLSGASLELNKHEAHYVVHVLRLQRGDRLVAFNGRGIERHASVDAMQRRGASLALSTERAVVLPESPLDLTLLQALPKTDAMDLIVQKATELGVRTIVPVYSEFGVVRLDAKRSERRLEHWRKIARSACEQCGRHTPPHIEPPTPLTVAIEALAPTTARLALDPEAGDSFGHSAPPRAGLITAVGPEGGFAAGDWRRLDAAGFLRVTLGRRVLRAETAAVAVCAIAQSLWGDL
jgi:16S rRNA (uracil1498-N3)-methyltransferase